MLAIAFVDIEILKIFLKRDGRLCASSKINIISSNETFILFNIFILIDDINTWFISPTTTVASFANAKLNS